MKQLIKDQRKFFNSNATKDVDFRIKQLNKLYTVIKDNEKYLMQAIYDDFKKSEFDTYTNELALLYSDIKEAIQKVRQWASSKKVRTNLINFPSKSYIIAEPLGVTLIIGAWNYPYQLSLVPVVASMVAGNTIVLKPSELPAGTSRAMAKIINNNFKPEYLTVVEGGVPETSALLNEKFDKIFFTGSVSVGKIVYQAAAKHLTPVTLELGGKSPAIVTEKCQIDICVKRLIWAKFLNAGQTCIAPDYAFVHHQIKDEFLALAKKEIQQSEFSFDNGNYVQIINEKNMERLRNLLDQSKVYHGGTYELSERYFEPTIMSDVSFDDKIMTEEIFGPILPVLTYDNIDTVINEIKARPKPLACYVFTDDNTIKSKILNEISFGGGGVNDAVMHITNSNMAFGGVGESGIGAYHGEAGFKIFTHYKSILDKSTLFEANLKYHPHTKNKLSLIKWMMG
ncbi:aldehyde dehydrogenase [Candidatus Magnetomorum sp. HK-1]|nr:aldehyde dehydrogenase [Candidatus Magnetomorum sp. HK-1]